EGELYLVDPTFAQFLKPRMFGVVGGEGEGLFRGNILKTDLAGTRFARDLVRDGFVRLTPENARLYVRALGIPEANAGEMAERLLSGERALLTEKIGGPGRIGLITEIPEFVSPQPNIQDLRQFNEELNRLIDLAKKDQKLVYQVPRLFDLQKRVEQALREPMWWEQGVHGPSFPLE